MEHKHLVEGQWLVQIKYKNVDSSIPGIPAVSGRIKEKQYWITGATSERNAYEKAEVEFRSDERFINAEITDINVTWEN